MLARPYRLKRGPAFRALMASGKALCRSPYFLVLGLRKTTETPHPPQFGFIVSKKVHNRAHRRNKVRRRLQELVRTRLIPIHANALVAYRAIVVIARGAAKDVPYRVLEDSLLQGFAR